MSFFVTRPWMPVPSISWMSRAFSAAIFRTSGEDRWRTRSSNDSTRPPPESAAGAAGRAGAVGAGAAGLGAGEGAAFGASGGGAGLGAAAVGAAAGRAGVAATGAAASVAGRAAGAGAGGAAVASPASPTRPTTVLIATVWPSGTLISTSVPATGDGISASTLSVEISKIGSSRLTGSPTFFNHFVIVPSAIDSPICGMMTSVAMTLPFATAV